MENLTDNIGLAKMSGYNYLDRYRQAVALFPEAVINGMLKAKVLPNKQKVLDASRKDQQILDLLKGIRLKPLRRTSRRAGDSEIGKLKKREREKRPEVADYRLPNLPLAQFPLYLLSVILFLLALLSKTSVVMLPVVLLLCAWWRRGRISRKDLLRSVPFFALSLALGLVTVWFQQQQRHSRRDGPPGGPRLARCGFRVDRLVLPLQAPPSGGPLRHLSALGRGRLAPPRVPAARCSCVAGMTLLWARRKSWGRAPLFAAGVLPHHAPAGPRVRGHVVHGVFARRGPSSVRRHDRRHRVRGGHPGRPSRPRLGILHPPSGHSPAKAGPGARLDHVAPALRGRIGAVAAAGCAVVLGILTWNRASLYGDDRSLWQDNVNKNPSAWLAWNNLGWTYYREGLDEKAVRFFDKAIELNPDFAVAYNNRAARTRALGRYAEALDDCNMAIQWKPSDALAYNTAPPRSPLWVGTPKRSTIATRPSR